MYRNENKINADIKSVLDNVLNSYGLTDWQSVQSSQPEQYANMEKIVKFFTVDVVRDGWQGSEYQSVDGNLIRIEKWRERRRVQIDCLMKRSITDTVDTITAVDVARMMSVYLNGTAGTSALFSYSFGRLLIDNVRIPASLDNTEKYRLYPGFDIVLVYDQTYETIEQIINGVSDNLTMI